MSLYMRAGLNFGCWMKLAIFLYCSVGLVGETCDKLYSPAATLKLVTLALRNTLAAVRIVLAVRMVPLPQSVQLSSVSQSWMTT